MKSKAKVRFKGLCKLLLGLTVFLQTPASIIPGALACVDGYQEKQQITREFEANEKYTKDENVKIEEQIKQSELGESYVKADKKFRYGGKGAALAGSAVGILTIFVLFANSNSIRSSSYDRPGHSDKGIDFSFSLRDNDITYLVVDGAKEIATGREVEK